MALDTVAGLFSRIQLNLGRGAHATVVAMIPEWVNLIQREVCRQGKWWFNFTEDSTTLSLAQSADTITLPADFLDDEYVFLQDSDGAITEVKFMENMEYRKKYTDLTGSAYEGLPQHYLLKAGTMLFRPIADEAYTVILGYWAQLADLVSGGSTNNLLLEYPDVLECGGTFKGFEYMQEYEDANYWRGRYEEELKKLRMANAEREFPGEMVLSIRPGQLSNRIGVRSRRNFY